MMGAFDSRVVLESLVWLRPEILLTLVGFAILGLAVVVPKEQQRWAGSLAVVGLIVAGTLVALYTPAVPFSGPKVDAGGAVGAFLDPSGHPALVVDGFSIVLKIIFLAGAVLTVLLAMSFLDVEDAQAAEFYALVLFAVLGMMFLASGNDFATIYIGLETMALSSYVLVGFTRSSRATNEAALKYFLLGAVASAVLLYGISLVFGATGSYNLSGIAGAIAERPRGSSTLLEIGAVLILVGMGFKIAAVPFHMWVPDAYEGAPTPVAAFLSTAAKAAAFAMLLRVFHQGFHALAAWWTPLLVVLSVASMTLGNVVAILQDNVKRMLAYSSIAHAGYLLMGLISVGGAAGDPLTQAHGVTAVVLYLLAYTFTNAGAFSLVVMLRRRGVIGDRVGDFVGLSRSNPWAAAAMVVFLMSLAGIPCTAGFIGKWWLFGAAVRADFAWLAVVAVVNSAISLYYYARIVVAMYMVSTPAPQRVPISAGVAATFGIAAAFTLWIGVYPQPCIRLAQYAVLPLAGR